MIFKSHPILTIATFITVLFSTPNLNAQIENTSKVDFIYKKFTGKIGNYPIVMDLIKEGVDIYGSYYYIKSGIPLELRGEINEDGSFGMLESDENYNSTGHFSGQISRGIVISGNWTNLKNDKSLPFYLEESTDHPLSIEFIIRFSENCDNVQEVDPEDDMEEENRCTTLDLKLIQVKTPSAEVTKKINQTILKAVFELDFGEERYTTIDELMNSVNAPQPYGGYERVISSSFIMNDKDILSIDIGQYYYGYGAAHPNGDGYCYNFNTKTGEIITLDEILIPNYSTPLNRIGETYFIKEYGSENWDFEVGSFELNTNFLITPTGLLFSFNRYEIGPYVMGVPSVFLPYSKISHLIKPNSLLKPWIKK